MRSTAALRDGAAIDGSLATGSDVHDRSDGSSLLRDYQDLFGTASPFARNQQSLPTCWHGAACLPEDTTAATRYSFSGHAHIASCAASSSSSADWRTSQEHCIAEGDYRMDARPRPPTTLSLPDLSSPVLSAPDSPLAEWSAERDQRAQDDAPTPTARRRSRAPGDSRRTSDAFGKVRKRPSKKKDRQVMAHERSVSGHYQPDVRFSSATIHSAETALACGLCGRLMHDRCVLRVGSDFCHSSCLVCYDCTRPLENDSSCFVRDGYVLCRRDYALRFGGVCSRCQDPIMPQELAHQASRHAYHIQCFACCQCHRQFSRGEQVFVDDHGAVFCRSHCYSYIGRDFLLPPSHVMAGFQHSSTSDEVALFLGHRGKHSRSKRVRTSFTEHQLTALQTSFSEDPNPDSQDLERIANSCGLTKRVVQVWFQNSRARQKRKSGKTGEVESTSTPPGLIAGSPSRDFQATSSTSLSESSLLDSSHVQLAHSTDDLTTKSLSLTSLGSSGETGLDLCTECGFSSSSCACRSLPASTTST